MIPDLKDIVSASKQMKEILKLLPEIANSSASVLITGESGTGKEVIARAIHYSSKRKESAFVRVNCAALPESLIESEFFGHEKGSFTGALQKRLGRFELADQGTLLLDEVTEIPVGLQAKLLRAIQEQEFERVGGTQSVKVDIRFISTSNRNIEEALTYQHLRKDLYYRLNVVPIYLPPLRERTDDILPLADYFLTHFSRQTGKKKKLLSNEMKENLLNHSWPGNIRELANMIERSYVLDPSSYFCMPEIKLSPSITLKESEQNLILHALKISTDEKTAAQRLGITIKMLRNKIKEHGM